MESGRGDLGQGGFNREDLPFFPPRNRGQGGGADPSPPPLSLHQAIRWRGLHLFLAEITEPVRGWMKIQAAVVELTECAADGMCFPGVLTEKYLAHAQETPMAVNASDYVLVTPKAVTLRAGRTAQIGEGRVMLVRTAHTADPWKNEYDVREEVDL